jgi:hypothetical protein
MGCYERRSAIAFALLIWASSATAQAVNLIGGRLQDRVHGVLSLMAYSVVPDLASSTLSVNDASTANPTVYMTQLAGGFNVSSRSPLYLEGGIAYSRYDPTFIASDGIEQRELPTKWNSLTATGGVGWDFPLDWSLPVGGVFKFRPIFNFALGRMQSDASVANWYTGREFGREVEFLKRGHVDAYGLGGSAMLVYNRFLPESETEVELRYTDILLKNFNGPDFLESSASAKTASLYARYRAPTGWHALDRPVRYVLEFSHSDYLGDQSSAMGFDALSTVGAGLELDSSAHDIWITRTRLVLRHMFGNNVQGTSVGLAVSF